MNERLKRIIFKKLDQDLGQAEIIVDDNKSIWFIDRAKKYWYLELRSSGTLWWRYSFFRDFFPLFGMEREEYEPVIAEWVEEVLKRKVVSTYAIQLPEAASVEEVLKRKVVSTSQRRYPRRSPVEEALNRKVVSTEKDFFEYVFLVEEVLKRKVSSTLHREFPLMDGGVEEALKRGVSSTRNRKNRILREVEEVLKRKVVSTSRAEYTSHLPVEEVLNNKL